MYIGRSKIRELLEGIEWVTPRNLSILANGYFLQRDYFVYKEELERMSETARIPKLKKLKNRHGDVAYAKATTKLKALTDFKIIHDMYLRDCLCKFLHDRNYDGTFAIRNDKNADAVMGNLYFEFDNGHMNNDQWTEKIRKYYSGRGEFQVVFWTAHKEDKEHLEGDRLQKLFDIAGKLLYDKPNRLLAATYSKFIENGKLYNFKGKEVEV